MTPNKKVVATAFAASVIAVTVPFLVRWEGTDLVAKRDPIGTGHPMTYCHGTTDEFGKVKAGQRFTPAQCDDFLAQSLPTYLMPLQACIKRPVPVKVMAAALDAAYNAGSGAACNSPMVRAFNQGNLNLGCNAFKGWYIRANGVVVRGLINRRNSEQQLCLQGVAEGLPKPPMPRWQRVARFLTFRS